ncbi:MAG: FAD-dependent oxidoreductase, partial [Candidatus Marinimicrobia bacterium]|nr:FAD-dependent oxidoreductase [Candidatus Neomarinimicrobiota bacterium]
MFKINIKEIDYQIIIIGTGVVGLSIAHSLAERGFKSVLVIEKESNFGRGISGRNSEVIHSGIYYPERSLKSKYCIQGRKLLSSYCATHGIFHKQCGKIIIANESQENDLMDLFQLGKSKNMAGLSLLTKDEISHHEPRIMGSLGLKIDSTGILDAHALMNSFYQDSQTLDHDYLYKSTVLDCTIISNGYEITIQSPASELEKVRSKWVINAAGLNSDLISQMILPKNKLPELIYSKGYYFSLSSRWKDKFSHLIYPMPDKEHRSLGVHLSFDQTGTSKLGPDAHFLENRIEDYSMDESLLNHFFEEASKYIIGLNKEDLSPDFSGIRPKIKNDALSFEDFYIAHES